MIPAPSGHTEVCTFCSSIAKGQQSSLKYHGTYCLQNFAIHPKTLQMDLFYGSILDFGMIFTFKVL